MEEDERKEFLDQTRLIAQRREFELIKVQREEAARIRRDKEIERRNLQKKERVERNKLVQKKILSKAFAKSYLRSLEPNVFRHLSENGYFTIKTPMKILEVLSEKYIPNANNMSLRSDINKAIFSKLSKGFFTRETSKHGILMQQVFDERQQSKEQKAKEAEEKRLVDIKFEEEKAERKEKHRVEKFTKVVEETILKTKYDKSDIATVPLCDIDDLTQVSSGIHTVGGQLGEFVIALQALLDELIYKFEVISNHLNGEVSINNLVKIGNTGHNNVTHNNDINNDGKSDEINTNNNQNTGSIDNQALIGIHQQKELNIELFIRGLINKFIQGLKDNEFFSLKYLESQRFDFTAIPDDEAKKKEFKQFLLDEKRLYNKSLKILSDQGVVEKKLIDIVISEITDIYFRQPIDPNNADIQAKINPQPDNQDPIYLARIKEEVEKITLQNSITEKMKKKIKILMVKPEILKKKRNNIISLIRVFPVEDTYETYTEEYVEEVIEQAINENNNNNKQDDNQENLNNMDNLSPNVNDMDNNNADNNMDDNNMDKTQHNGDNMNDDMGNNNDMGDPDKAKDKDFNNIKGHDSKVNVTQMDHTKVSQDKKGGVLKTEEGILKTKH